MSADLAVRNPVIPRKHSSLALRALAGVLISLATGCSSDSTGPDGWAGIPEPDYRQYPLRIMTWTTGGNVDPDGYLLTIDSSVRGTIQANDTVQTSVLSGTHKVGLSGVDPRCRIEGEAVRTVTITDNSSGAKVRFYVKC